jgi:hypothetical protein
LCRIGVFNRNRVPATAFLLPQTANRPVSDRCVSLSSSYTPARVRIGDRTGSGNRFSCSRRRQTGLSATGGVPYPHLCRHGVYHTRASQGNGTSPAARRPQRRAVPCGPGGAGQPRRGGTGVLAERAVGAVLCGRPLARWPGAGGFRERRGRGGRIQSLRHRVPERVRDRSY